MVNMDRLVAELVRDEGVRLKPYRDTVGKLTIGIGRNLDDVGVSREEAEHLLANDIAAAMDALDGALPWWQTLDPVRQRVLVNMMFNLGLTRLLGFKNTLGMIQAGRYVEAADAMLLSKWAEQVGPRAVRLSNLMRSGKEPTP